MVSAIPDSNTRISAVSDVTSCWQPVDGVGGGADTRRVPGGEVAECCVIPRAKRNGGFSPELKLAGFERTFPALGERRTIRFTVSPRELSEVSGEGVRSVQPGAYSLSIGGGQPHHSRGATLTPSRRIITRGTLASSPWVYRPTINSEQTFKRRIFIPTT